MLSGYRNRELIHNAGSFRVFRAERETGERVIIKLVADRSRGPQRARQLVHEARVRSNLADVQGVTEAVELLREGPSVALVLPDVGGSSLRSLLESAPTGVGLEQFWDIALALADTIAGLHARDVIHKDLNPSNIFWLSRTRSIEIVDFSICTLLTRERQSTDSADSPVGSLPYMSPERSGLMDSGVDYRTDLYSVGVSLYELLGGRLPFSASDRAGWIHAHMAQVPPSIQDANPSVPGALAQVIAKLLEKDPQDRYQSAIGLRSDLELLREGGESGADFVPGTRDVRATFCLPTQAYGRGHEIAALLRAYDRAAEGGRSIVALSGPSGIGKSTLVSALQRAVVKAGGEAGSRKRDPGALFAVSKLEHFQPDVPFHALKTALTTLSHEILRQPEPQVSAMRSRVKSAMGPNAGVILDIVPSLRAFIGDVAEPPTVAGDKARHGIHQTLTQFFCSLASPEHPVVLFFDDLQWTDSASLDFVLDLALSEEGKFIAVVLAYQDQELSGAPRITERLAKAEGVYELDLKPLPASDIALYVADALQCSIQDASPLAEVLRQKSGGNPQFIGELVSEFYRSGKITFSRAVGSWVPDLEAIAAARVSDSVADFLLDSLKALPNQTQDCLRYAACLGSVFDLRTLSIIVSEDPRDCIAVLWHALERRLVAPLSDAYKTVDDSSTAEECFQARFRFQHDRVHRACQELLPDSERGSAHWRIGQLMLAGLDPQEVDDRILEIVGHCNAGVENATSLASRLKLLRLNLSASRQARRQGAWQATLDHARQAKALLPPEPWRSHHEVAFEVECEVIEALRVNGSHEDAAKLGAEALRETRLPVDRAKVRRLMCGLFTVCGDNERAQHEGLAGLRELGVDFPPHPSGGDVGREFRDAMQALGGRDVASLVELPPITDPTTTEILDLCVTLGGPCYVSGNQNLFALSQLFAAKVCLERGVSTATPVAFAALGMLLTAHIQDFELAEEFCMLATELEERQWVSKRASWTYFARACFVGHWRMHTRDLEQLLERAVEASEQTGSVECQAYSLVALARIQPTLVDLETATQIIESYLPRIEQTRTEFYPTLLKMIRNYWKNLRGEVPDPLSLSSDDCDLDVEIEKMRVAKYLHGVSLCHLYRLKLLVNRGLYADAYAEGQHVVVQTFMGLYREPEFRFYHALAAGRAYHELPSVDQPQAKVVLAEGLAWFQALVDQCRPNLGTAHDILAAQQARILGDVASAERHYDSAISTAKIQCYPEMVALAYELAGEHYYECNRHAVARVCLQEAARWYGHWGAIAKLEQLIDRYGDMIEAGVLASDTAGWGSEPATPMPVTVDLATLLHASQALSQEVALESVLRKLVKLVKEGVGAQRVFLVLRKDDTDEFYVEAESTELRTTVMRHIPLDECESVPSEMARWVIEHQRESKSGDAAVENQLPSFAHFQANHVKSVLCMPVIRQGQTTAVLYLENSAVRNAFTQSRMVLLRVLSSQVAISIANAQAYDMLEQRVADRTLQLQRKTDELNLMLQSMQQGIFTVLPDLTIHPAYSAYLELILEKQELAGEPAIPLLFSGSNIKGERRSLCEATVHMILGQDEGLFFVNEHGLVRECVREAPGGKPKILELTWTPIVKNGLVERIMVTVKDVTEFRSLEIDAKKGERELAIVGEILKGTIPRYHTFVREARGLIAKAEEAADAGKDSEGIRRGLHTLKGSAGICGYSSLAEVFARVEADFIANPDDLDKLGDSLLDCESALVSYEKVYREKLSVLGHESGVAEFWDMISEKVSATPDDLVEIGRTVVAFVRNREKAA